MVYGVRGWTEMNLALRKRSSRKEFLKVLVAGAALAGCAGGMCIACGPALAQKLTVEPVRVRETSPLSCA
jgi:hypothetical protein